MKISHSKTSLCLAFIIFCAISASFLFFIKKSQLKADVFEDLFKNIDFEQLAKDMEKMISEAEDKADLPKMPPVPATGATAGTSGSTGKLTETKTLGPKKDRRTLFLNPDTKIVETKNQKTTEPTKESRKALSSYVQEMNKNLTIFEKNIEANKKLSPQFKEKYLYEIRKKIDEIVVASELINSKKVYQKIFLTTPTSTSTPHRSKQDISQGSADFDFSDTPTPKSSSGFGKQTQANTALQNSMKQLRQRYLSLIDELNVLNEKLKVTEEEEAKEEDKATLEELADTQMESLPGYTPLVPLKPKVRGAKVKATIPQKRASSVKKPLDYKNIKSKTPDIESQTQPKIYTPIDTLTEVQTGVPR